jgi:hypothetical protein
MKHQCLAGFRAKARPVHRASTQDTSEVHNTRFKAKRRPVVNASSGKKVEKGGNKKARVDKEADDGLFYVVLPNVAVYDVEPLMTDHRQEFEERLLEFDSPNDYVTHMNLSVDVAAALVEFNKMPVIPCPESGEKPFVTTDQNAVNQFVMSVDPFAHTFEHNTLEDANKLIAEQTMKGANNSGKPVVETVTNKDDDESVDSPSNIRFCVIYIFLNS